MAKIIYPGPGEELTSVSRCTKDAEATSVFTGQGGGGLHFVSEGHEGRLQYQERLSRRSSICHALACSCLYASIASLY